MEFDTIDIDNQAQVNCLLALFMDPSVRNDVPFFEMFSHFQDLIHLISVSDVSHNQRIVRLENEYIGWVSMERKEVTAVSLCYAVVSSKRGYGYDKQIIEEFINQCEDTIEQIEMQVEENNIYSRKVLEELHFEKRNENHQYFYQIPRQNRIS